MTTADTDPVIHILWMNGGLGWDGDSVALTAATQPSIEEIVLGALSGLSKVAVHWPLIDFECGPEQGGRQPWDRLGIPVGSVFFLRGEDGTTAFYPSPAGATECLLDLDTWAALAAAHPLLAAAEPEVEAILVRADQDGVECFLVPADVCCQLVGRVRMYRQGFDGGAEAKTRIEEFFATIRRSATPLER